VEPYLFLPPDPNAPLEFWSIWRIFPSEAECNADIPVETRVVAPYSKLNVQEFHYARCVSEQDWQSEIKKSKHRK
jgi:hypothetical protein